MNDLAGRTARLVVVSAGLGDPSSSRMHSLALDYAIRPVFAYLRTTVVPTGVYAATSDWGSAGGGPAGDGADAGLARRVARAADELAELTAATAGTRRPEDPFALPAGFDPSGIRDIVDEGVLADQVGLGHFGVGEHHRDDFAVSAPEIVLTAVAARTSSIRLGSAVTVLSSDDPVRVYQRFATLDAVSGGRAEITVGRGSFTESFPLFGHDLADYEKLFEEKLELLAALRAEKPVTWSGTVRGALDAIQVHPTTDAGGLPVWVGVGGSPESVVRAARHGMPMMLAIIGGDPARFRPFVQLYHDALQQFGHAGLPLGVHSGGFVAPTDAEAREIHYGHYRKGIDRIGRERGWPPLTPQRYQQDVERGSSYVGSPETVARRIADTIRTLDAQRFDLKYSAGALPHADLMRSIELFGTEVVPQVRELLRSDTRAHAVSA